MKRDDTADLDGLRLHAIDVELSENPDACRRRWTDVKTVEVSTILREQSFNQVQAGDSF